MMFCIEDELGNTLYLHHEIRVDIGQNILRIDKYLVDRVQNMTRSKIQSLLANKLITVNDKNVKSNYKVHPRDIIKIYLPKEPKTGEVIPENIPLDILYEDSALLIVNKPAGMVVHPAYNNWSKTLVNALVYHFKNLPNKQGNIGRPGLVHRIDKDTSGILVIAKTEASMVHLSKQFHDHTIERKYQALVWGNVNDDEGTINKNLIKSSKDRKIVITTRDQDTGKTAITHYRVLKRYEYVTLIECILETGRTHQIRSHLKSIGHVLFGDEVYGGLDILKGPLFSKYKSFINNCFKIMPRQALHAKSLKFVHPITKKTILFESDLPKDFQLVLDKWDRYLL